MKKQTIIILILCILLIAVIALSALGVIGPQGSLAGFTGYPEVLPTVTSSSPTPNTWERPGITLP